jgi:hypothetical protein
VRLATARAALFIRRWVIWGPFTIAAYAYVCTFLLFYGVTRRPARAGARSLVPARVPAATPVIDIVDRAA